MKKREVLLNYGKAGDFGRFRAAADLPCRRGDQLIVRTPRGLELGTVLCEANAGHLRLLKSTPVGEVVRPATPGDVRTATRLQGASDRLIEDAREAAQELGLPMQVLDAEILLDGRNAVLYFVSGGEYDPCSFLKGLARQHRIEITLQDLAVPAEFRDEASLTTCGSGNCGSGGSCGSCGSGGCSSCGHHATANSAHGTAETSELRRVPLFST